MTELKIGDKVKCISIGRPFGDDVFEIEKIIRPGHLIIRNLSTGESISVECQDPLADDWSNWGHIFAKIEIQSIDTCTHEYLLYQGLNESFYYCKHCDGKEVRK